MKTKKYFYFVFIFLFVLISINFSHAASYGSGPYGAGAYGIGYTAPVTPVTPDGGEACTYNWDCTNWFPSECPVSGIQERICANRGTCTGISGMPNQVQNCTYEHKEPLFDIFLKIFEDQKICAGGKIKANVRLENYGKIELIDAFMTYWIIDENNKLVSEVKDTRNVADKLEFDTSIKIPAETNPGIYRLYAQITYSGNKIAIAGESFNILERDSCGIFPSMLVNLFILVVFGFLIFIIIIIFLAKRLHTKKEREKVKEKKEEKKIESYYIPLFKE